jgi:hypothetical protein
MKNDHQPPTWHASFDWRPNSDRYAMLIERALEASAGDVSAWAKHYWKGVAARLLRNLTLEMACKTDGAGTLGRARPARRPTSRRKKSTDLPAVKRSAPVLVSPRSSAAKALPDMTGEIVVPIPRRPAGAAEPLRIDLVLRWKGTHE